MAIARVALPVATYSLFDYWVPTGITAEPGSVVRASLGRRSLTGVVVETAEVSAVAPEKLLPIGEVMAIPRLSSDLLEVAQFVAGYYQEPLGLVLAQVLPPVRASEARAPAPSLSRLALTAAGLAVLPLRVSRSPRAREVFDAWRAAPNAVLEPEALRALPSHLRAAIRGWVASGWAAPIAPDESPRTRVVLNSDQEAAAAAIIEAHGAFAPFLLQGITGSGKTEVYLAAAGACIDTGGQVLMLVPEINLTPQLAHRIAAALPGRRTVTLHSRLSAGERRRHWAAAAVGEVDLLLGTRLATFAPMPRLALIVVDEEHDPSYKQQDNVRYHGRDVAIWRARQRKVPIVLGSATPALETFVHARDGRYRWLRLTRRAAEPARLPALRYVPARSADAVDGIGRPLLAAIAARIERGEQSLVFINRRGFAPSLLCSACGWQAGCPRCSARLVVHRDLGQLRCHHCSHVARLPRACPECGNVDLLPLGHGTQRLERALAERFPSARLVRVDRDTTKRRGAFAEVRERVHAGEVDILVGTQMLAKGHDFPRLTLVGVLGADNALYSGDFRATERLGALLFQVAGRAGRAGLPGEVIVQTDFPDHALYRALARHDYDGLADVLLAERKAAGLPPYGHLALLAAEAPRREAVDAFLQAAHVAGVALVRDRRLHVEVWPPVPAALARRAGLERGQVLVQSTERSALQRFLAAWCDALATTPARRVRWALDVDPLGFA